MSIKICMINDEHFPFKAADTINVVRTASGLGAAGADVDLIVPRLWKGNLAVEPLCEYYGAPPSFNLIRIPTPLPTTRRFRLEKLSHSLLAPWLAVIKRADVVYSRNLMPLAIAQLLGKPWVFETYRRFAEESPWLAGLTRHLRLDRALAAVTHSRRAADGLEQLGFDRDALLVAYSGYLEQEVLPRLGQAQALKLCGLDLKPPIVLHLGNIDPYIRIDLLYEMASRLPQVSLLFVGGYQEQQDHWSQRARQMGLTNVHFVANQPPARVREYLYTADVLSVVPRHADMADPGANLSLSLYKVLPGIPMKIMLYSASGIPIFAPDLPYLTEVLRHGENACLYPVDDMDTAAERLRQLVEDRALAARVANTAQTEGHFVSWSERGQRILDFVQARLQQRGRA